MVVAGMSNQSPHHTLPIVSRPSGYRLAGGSGVIIVEISDN